jgi:hypothetical protein
MTRFSAALHLDSDTRPCLARFTGGSSVEIRTGDCILVIHGDPNGLRRLGIILFQAAEQAETDESRQNAKSGRCAA